MSVSGMSKRYNQLRSAIDELYAKVARGLFPGGPSHLFVNIVEAFGVDNTGGADAAVKINTALTALAATGQTAYSPEGTYRTVTPITPPSGSQWRGDPGAAIHATIPTGDGHTDSPFVAATPWDAAVTTLAATCVEGAYTVQVASVAAILATITVGGYLNFEQIPSSISQSYRLVGVGITGSADITAAGLYGGGGTLNGETLILNVNGAGPVTLTLNGGTNTATEAALIAAIQATWPALTMSVQGPGFTGVNLVLTAATSVVVGAGTANGHLGLTAGLNDTVQVDEPLGYTFPVTATNVNTFPGGMTSLQYDFQHTTMTVDNAGRGMWLAYNQDTIFENLNISDNGIAGMCFNFDEGGRRNTFSRGVTIATPGQVGNAVGCAMENGQDGLLDRMYVWGNSIGYTVAGLYHEVRGCRAYNCGFGLSLQNMSPGDNWAARFIQVQGGSYSGNGYGVNLQDNAFGNVLTGVVANYNGTQGDYGYGFVLDAGNEVGITITCGVSQNKFVGCHARGNLTAGYAVGDDSTPNPHDGNTFIGCTANNSQYGWVFHGGATNTALVGCKVINDSVSPAWQQGFAWSNATATGTTLTTIETQNCSSAGINTYADIDVNGWVSTNDGTALLTQGAAVVRVSNFSWSVGVAGGTWYGLSNNAANTISLCHGNISPYAGRASISIYMNAGTLYLEDVAINGNGGGTSYGIYGTGGAITIGPNVTVVNCSNPITFGGATYTMCQTGGVAAVSATVSLTFAQHYNTSIELASGAAADSTITTYPIPGMQWVARNLSAHNLILKTSTAATVTVAATKSAVVQVKANGDMVRVSPDT